MSLLLVVVALAGAIGGHAADVEGEWWPQFRHAANHSGAVSGNVPSAVDVLWQFTTGGDVRSSAAVVQGNLFVGSDDGSLYCIDAQSGAKVWVLPFPSDKLWSSPAVTADGRAVLVATAKGQFLSASTSAGSAAYPAVNWRTGLGAPVVASPTIFQEGGRERVIIGAMDGQVSCLDVATGEQTWRFNASGPVYSSVAASPALGLGVVGSSDNYLYAFHLSNGSLLWKVLLDDDVRASPLIDESAKRIVVATTVFSVYSFYVNGTVAWKNSRYQAIFYDMLPSSPALAPNGFVIIGSPSRNVYAFNGRTGEAVWIYPTGGPVLSSPTIDLASNVVYVGSYDDLLHAIDVSTGNQLFTIETQDVSASPSIWHNTLYVGSHDNTIYAIGGVGKKTTAMSLGLIITTVVAAMLLFVIGVGAFYCQRRQREHISRELVRGYDTHRRSTLTRPTSADSADSANLPLIPTVQLPGE